MSIKPFRAFLLAMAVAVLFGALVTGPLLVQNFRDLDPSAYPFGNALLSFAQSLAPDINRVVGPVWAFGSLFLEGLRWSRLRPMGLEWLLRDSAASDDDQPATCKDQDPRHSS